MRVSNNKGFALLSVLIFLEIFAMLTIFSLRSASWEMKMIQQRDIKNKMTQAASIYLRRIEALAPSSDCQIAITPSQQLVHRPISWWQNHACSGIFNLFQYYYVIEILGEDPCAEITTTEKNGRNIAMYSRITLLFILKSEPTVKMFLQSSSVSATDSTAICDSVPHSVKSGRQSARELID